MTTHAPRFQAGRQRCQDSSRKIGAEARLRLVPSNHVAAGPQQFNLPLAFRTLQQMGVYLGIQGGAQLAIHVGVMQLFDIAASQ